MSIHPETMKVINLPDTVGKRVALKHFDWQSLDKISEVMLASSIISMAKTIDDQLSSLPNVYEKEYECKFIPKIPEPEPCPNCGKTPQWLQTENGFELSHDWRDSRWCPERFGGVFKGLSKVECVDNWNNRTIRSK